MVEGRESGGATIGKITITYESRALRHSNLPVFEIF
jgi:hypothetical protein